MRECVCLSVCMCPCFGQFSLLIDDLLLWGFLVVIVTLLSLHSCDHYTRALAAGGLVITTS